MSDTNPVVPPVKTCPFCKEQVHQDALKCRFCQSAPVLLPAAGGAEAPPGAGKVKYVVDEGLVTFAKFVGGALALFVVVGAYLFGFKLDNALGKVEEQEQELTKLLAVVRTSRAQVDSAKLQLEASMIKVTRLETAFEDSVRQKQNRATIFFAVQQLNFGQQSTLKTVKNQRPESFRRGTKFWQPGSELRIRFLSGTPAQRRKIRALLSQWFPLINLRFQFVDQGPSQMRISIGHPNEGDWAYLGTDALAVAENQPTINYGYGLQDSRSAMREFGHALGLINEWQNPNAHIPWNKPVVFKYFATMQGWSATQIQANLLDKIPTEIVGTYRPFDPNSVMMVDLNPALTDSKVVPVLNGFTASDKELLGNLYPH